MALAKGSIFSPTRVHPSFCARPISPIRNQDKLSASFTQRQWQLKINTLFAHPTETEEWSSTNTGHSSADDGSDDFQSAIDKNLLLKLDSCRTRSAACKILDQALPTTHGESSQRLYNSVKIPRDLSIKSLSDAELALQTRTINSKYTILELIEQNGDRDIDRASLAVLCVFLGGAFSAILAQQLLTEVIMFGHRVEIPDILRFVIVWTLSFSPLLLVGYGLALPEQLTSALVTIQRQLFPSYRKRMIQHEAGHFLVGHMLGWPVRTYRVSNAVKNAVEFYPLSDSDVGKDRAEALGFDTIRRGSNDDGYSENAGAEEERDSNRPYFSEKGRGADMITQRSVFRDDDSADTTYLSLPPEDDPKNSWPFRGFDDATLDILAVISVAGACAEILAYGNAEGGAADFSQLRRIYGSSVSASKNGSDANGRNVSSLFDDDAKRRRLQREGNELNKNDGSSKSGLDEKEMDNRTRFALGFAIGLLRQNLGALDALAEVMEKQGTVSECILAIESCPNVGGYTVKGDYDKIRRQTFVAEEQRGFGGWVERIFLGGGKTIDVEDSTVIYGKGGGDKQQFFSLSGDDPLYAAVAVAAIFFVWASNGGLSLH